MVPRIQQFEASGVKLVLKDEVKLRAALVAALDGALPDDGKREAINAVHILRGCARAWLGTSAARVDQAKSSRRLMSTLQCEQRG